MIYWGYPDYFGTAGDAYLADPTLIIGKKLNTTSLGLRKIPGDTVYYPIHSLVYGTQNINIGKDDLQAHLKHASAALSVIVSEQTVMLSVMPLIQCGYTSVISIAT